MVHTDWRPEPGLSKKRGKEVWDHEAPHEISTGEVDGDVSFDPEVLEGFRDGDEDDAEDERSDPER